MAADWNLAPQAQTRTAQAGKRLPLTLASAVCGSSLVWHKHWAAQVLTSVTGLTQHLTERTTAWTLAAVLSAGVALLSAWLVQDIGLLASAAFRQSRSRGVHHAQVAKARVCMPSCHMVQV